MKSTMNLRVRLGVTLCLLVSVSMIGAGAMIWYTFRVETMVNRILTKNLSSYQAAEDLEIALVNQKGYVSYYVIDKDPAWLRQLGEWRQVFRERLTNVREEEKDPEAASILNLIDIKYTQYIQHKDLVLKHYADGDMQIGLNLHDKLRDEFFKIMALCESYKEHHEEQIGLIRDKSAKETRRLREITISALIVQLGAGLFLAFILVGQVLEPLKVLARKTQRDKSSKHQANLVKELADNVDDLLRDAGETHDKLEKSRESLMMAEKMAMVGKLAAGMAHSVRNPLTSVKMRLFSLNRSLSLNEDQAEDLMVISEEIEHVDTIVQNFLEFSRPPKLQMQVISPSTVVDMMLQLLAHRLKSYDVTVKVEREAMLPNIKGDPEQLKEVLVNLVENACQAMGRGGLITIFERTMAHENGRSACVLMIRDTGPGMNEQALEKAFNPFFTTKEEGTGLGLPIAQRIIENHGGSITAESRPGEGATFTILLPVLNGDAQGDHR